MKINRVLKIVSLIAAIAAPAAATAHTTAIGSTLGMNPGETTIWLGTYHSGAGNEGSLTIGGTTYAFDLLTTSQPAGLIAGINYFYSDCPTLNGFGCGNGFTSAVETTSSSWIADRWQGVSVTGLAAGIQPYAISGMNSINWANFGTGDPNWGGSVLIPMGSVASVPAPASLALFGLGLLGLGFSRRKQA